MWAIFAIETLSNASPDTSTNTLPNISIIVSLTSLIIAFSSAYYNRKTYKIREMQELDRQKEMRRAQLIAQLIVKPRAQGGLSDYLLRISNIGKARARDIKISIDDIPMQELPLFKSCLVTEQEIPRELVSGETRSFPLADYAKFNIKISWLDDSGDSQHYEQGILPVLE